MTSRSAAHPKVRVFIADGEFAEHLGARFAKQMSYLPCLSAFLRCSMHAAQRSAMDLVSARAGVAWRSCVSDVEKQMCPPCRA